MDRDTQQQLLKTVKNNYEEVAEDYDRTRRKHSDPLRQELEKYVQKVREGDKVLDVGCGNARLLELLSEGVDYLGADSSESLINISKERFPGHKFQVVDVLELDRLKEKGFNYVFCIAVLHHLPGRQLRIKALRQMRDKLSSDGELVISVWNLWSQKKMRKRIIRFLLLKILGKNKMDIGDITFDWKDNKKRTVSKRYYHAFTKRELKKVVKKGGLVPKKIYKDKYNYFVVATRKK